MLQPTADNDFMIASPNYQISPFTGVIDAKRLIRIFLSNKSDKTISAYRKDLKDFARFLGIKDGNLDRASRVFFSNGRGHANSLAAEYREHLGKANCRPQP
jgi:hypothetical protein